MKKNLKPLFVSVLVMLLGSTLRSQELTRISPDEELEARGEVYFTFQVPSPFEMESLTRLISIDNFSGNQVYAYANRKEFDRFLALGYEYTLLPHPGTILNELELRPPGTGEGILTTWNFYPTYQEYLDFMDGFANTYPDICKLVFIGTTVQGRELLAVKISDNVDLQEPEPEFFYTSTMHGDEYAGYVLMLHLIDYLLTNYGTDPRITSLVDHTEIFINPLANPDGTYWAGNNSVYGARRYNANGVDLNRNFPDPEDGPHPDGNEWQPETIAFMDFADSNHFVMSANFHGGAEVFNYPWDTWAKLHADDGWWQFVGHEYADTVHLYSPSYYFNGFNNGITNGYAWYTISGGRQDYMNYWHSCREATIELSDIKTLPANQLLNHWNYNYRSFLNYIEQSAYGVQGFVTDSVTGEPLQARIYIPGYDIDNSYVDTKLPSGYYSRLLLEGTYHLRFSSVGYFPKTIYDVSVTNWATTPLDVQLVPLNIGMGDSRHMRLSLAYPNPSDGMILLLLPESEASQGTIECFNMKGERVFRQDVIIIPERNTLHLDLGHLASGLYLLKLSTGITTYTDRIILR